MKELIKLMQENPELEVVPLVDAQVIGDAYGLWEGKIKDVKIDYIHRCEDDSTLLKSKDEKKLKKKIKWKKVIIVWIGVE